MPSLIADLLDRLEPERRYEFEERAGTIEFDSSVPRDEAEALALIDLLRSHPAALVGVTALEVDHDGGTDTVITTDLDSVDRHFGRESLAHIVDLAEVGRVGAWQRAVVAHPGDCGGGIEATTEGDPDALALWKCGQHLRHRYVSLPATTFRVSADPP